MLGDVFAHMGFVYNGGATRQLHPRLDALLSADALEQTRRQFLSLVFGGVWLDQDRVVAVQPKPSFLPFFEQQRPRTHETAG